MTKIKQIILMVMANCLTTGCNSSDTAGDAPLTVEHPILFSGLSIGEDATRTGVADLCDNSLPEGSSVGVYIYKANGTYLTGKVNNADVIATWVYQTGAPYASGSDTYKAALSLTSHDKTPNFPQTNNVYDSEVTIFAVYPVPSSSDYSPTTGGSYTVEVPIDQTGSTTAKQSDIASADLLTTDGKMTFTSEQCVKNGEMVNLRMIHRMAKVTVVFTPKVGSDLTAANMPTKFDVIGVYRELTVTPSTGTVTTTTSGATTESSPLKGSTTQSFFIPPQTLASGTRLLKFNILGSGTFRGISGASFTLPAAQTFAAGTHYTITVTLDVDFATLTETINGWVIEEMEDSDFRDNESDGSGTTVVL